MQGHCGEIVEPAVVADAVNDPVDQVPGTRAARWGVDKRSKGWVEQVDRTAAADQFEGYRIAIRIGALPGEKEYFTFYVPVDADEDFLRRVIGR